MGVGVSADGRADAVTALQVQVRSVTALPSPWWDGTITTTVNDESTLTRDSDEQAAALEHGVIDEAVPLPVRQWHPLRMESRQPGTRSRSNIPLLRNLSHIRYSQHTDSCAKNNRTI